MAYIAEGPRPVRLAGSIGDRLPIHAAAGAKAILAFQTCAETYPDSSFAGESLERIANFYIATADYNRAIELMELALDNLAREETPRESSQAWILRVIGESRLGLGELDAAETELRKSLAIEQQIRAADAAVGLSGLGADAGALVAGEVARAGLGARLGGEGDVQLVEPLQLDGHLLGVVR